MQLADQIKLMNEYRDAAANAVDPERTTHFDFVADIIENELRDLAYINACESDSPNSPDFENVLSAELLKLGIEE